VASHAQSVACSVAMTEFRLHALITLVRCFALSALSFARRQGPACICSSLHKGAGMTGGTRQVKFRIGSCKTVPHSRSSARCWRVQRSSPGTTQSPRARAGRCSRWACPPCHPGRSAKPQCVQPQLLLCKKEFKAELPACYQGERQCASILSPQRAFSLAYISHG